MISTGLQESRELPFRDPRGMGGVAHSKGRRVGGVCDNESRSRLKGVVAVDPVKAQRTVCGAATREPDWTRAKLGEEVEGGKEVKER